MAQSGRLAPTNLIRKGLDGPWAQARQVRGLILGKRDRDPTQHEVATSASSTPPVPTETPPPLPSEKASTAVGDQPPSGKKLLKEEWYPKVVKLGEKAPPILKRGLAEAKEICIAMATQTARLARYATAMWRRRSLRKRLFQARVALGEKMYQCGIGDDVLRSRIAELDGGAESIKAANGSARALDTERRDLLVRLSSSFDVAEPGPRIEHEHQRVARVQRSLAEHEEEMGEAWAGLPPADEVTWRRVGIGYCTASALFVGFLFLAVSNVSVPTGGSSASEGITRDELRLASEGITRDELRLASHTVLGTWTEEDLVVNDIQEWNGSTGVLEKWFGSSGVLEKKSWKLHLITNSHCLGLGDLSRSDDSTDGIPEVRDYQLEVVFTSGKKKRVLRFADPAPHPGGRLDLAMLEVDAAGLEEGVDYAILRYRENLNLLEGDDVVAVGSPHMLQGTQTFGKISALRNGSGQPHRLIQTDAAINEGNSGGPLFRKSSDGSYIWIGVNTWKISVADNLGFAIDARDARNTRYHWFPADAIGARTALRTLYGK